MTDGASLVLASSSPRRLALLRQVGIEPDLIVAPGIDEAPHAKELPRHHAARLAEEKLDAGRRRLERSDAFVLAADTVVACGRRILPKPDDMEAAERCLALLSGRRHTVIGGVAIAAPDGTVRRRVVRTAVRFKRLSAEELERYLASGEWRGKAGGYAIQGRAEAFIPEINGSWSNVVGLPLAETVALLRGLGYRGGS